MFASANCQTGRPHSAGLSIHAGHFVLDVGDVTLSKWLKHRPQTGSGRSAASREIPHCAELGVVNVERMVTDHHLRTRPLRSGAGGNVSSRQSPSNASRVSILGQRIQPVSEASEFAC